ncbi:aminotransferase class IV [Micrococcales bacterium 31B]|nr:aminotransferase class IV [Micrococcales bacterium 31B]
MTAPILVLLEEDGAYEDDFAEPLIHADDTGVLRGDGVFEATLAQDGYARDLEEHMARLYRSAAMLDLALPDKSQFEAAIAKVLSIWTMRHLDDEFVPDLVVRWYATRGREGADSPVCWATGAPVPPDMELARLEGMRVITLNRGFEVENVIDSPWLLPGAKSLSYGINIAGYREAKKRGAEDVIFVTPSGRVLEGPTSNVVIKNGRTISAPPVEGILDGITVERLLRTAAAAGFTVERRVFSRDELFTADGVWLTSSVRLLAPVTHIDGERIRFDEEGSAELATMLD